MKIISFKDLEILTTDTKSQTAIILLHGFGANMHDLAPLARYLDPQNTYTWFFPNGILEIPLSPLFDARAWALLNLQQFDTALKEHRFRDYLDSVSDRMIAPSEKISEFVHSLQNQYSKIYIGGFSQGAMLALDVALSCTSIDWAGIILFSTTFAAEKRWLSFLQNDSRHLRLFQSHGLNDTILPFEFAKELFHTLHSFGHTIEFHEFQGGHEIPEPILKQLKKQL